PSGEIARTFPGADLFSPTLVETTINPFVPNSPRFVPRYAFLPCRSNNNEFGVAGRPTAFPTVFAGIAMGTRIVTQPSRTPHPVLEANRVELAGVVLFAGGVTITCRAVSGYTGVSGVMPILYVGGVQEAITLAPPTPGMLTPPLLLTVTDAGLGEDHAR